jgi:hypothetical protein
MNLFTLGRWKRESSGAMKLTTPWKALGLGSSALLPIISIVPGFILRQVLYPKQGISREGRGEDMDISYGLKQSDVPPPLGNFQHTTADRSEVLKMLQSINRRLKDVEVKPLPDNRLEEVFDTFWSKLEERLKDIKTEAPAPVAKVVRDQREVLWTNKTSYP